MNDVGVARYLHPANGARIADDRILQPKLLIRSERHQGDNGYLMAVPGQEVGENVGESCRATELWREKRGVQRHPHSKTRLAGGSVVGDTINVEPPRAQPYRPEVVAEPSIR